MSKYTVLESSQSVTEFMSGHISRCKIPGYEATFNLLNDFEKNSIEYDQNEKFINYLAALEFHDIVGIWDAFDAYTNDVIIKQELEPGFQLDSFISACDWPSIIKY